MKAISLRQPWATLIAIGTKTIETRSWETGYRGPIAIHAAKRNTTAQWKLGGTPPFSTGLRKHKWYDLPHGCIVAVATLERIVPTQRCSTAAKGEPRLIHIQVTEQELAFGDFSPNRFAWLLKDVRPLRLPMPCVGRQGIFNVTGLCRVCGCWDQCACACGCSWIEPDLCSRCAGYEHCHKPA